MTIGEWLKKQRMTEAHASIVATRYLTNGLDTSVPTTRTLCTYDNSWLSYFGPTLYFQQYTPIRFDYV
jgi:hypothetical protein